MPGIEGIGLNGRPQAAGSCHKDPSGASTRAGRKGPKIVKKRRLLPASSFKRGQLPGIPRPIRFPVIRGPRPAPPNHGLALLARGGAGPLRRGAAKSTMV